MKDYEVLIPITGFVIVNVKADDEDSAITNAFESDELSLDNIVEWEAHGCIVKGNIFYGTLNEIEVNEA